MKIYRVIDNSELVLTTTELAEVGKWFIRLTNKYPKQTWYWVEEEIL